MRILAALFALLAVAVPSGAADDPFFDQQWALATMHVEAAWRAGVGTDVVVAVVDSGVDLSHPDLAGRLTQGKDFIDGDFTPQDENGHGTHMAGSIAAVAGNGIGIAGIAPQARIMPVRVLDGEGRASDPTIVSDGIRWAVDNGARVVNLSLAADGPGNPIGGQDLLATAPIDLAIRDAVSRGALVVIAAGNNPGGGRSSTSYDATVNGALVVGASTRDDRRAAYSNYGDGLDVIAPGGGSALDPSFGSGCTASNAIVGLYWNPEKNASDYAAACGTSVAVAQVSGIGALLIELGYSNTSAAQRIIDSAADVGPRGRDDQTGHGRADAARALRVSAGPPAGGTASPTPRATPRVGAVGSTSTARPAGSSSDRIPSIEPAPSEVPQAAGEPPAAPDDRSTPLAVAGALVFFTAWGFLGALGRVRVRDDR